MIGILYSRELKNYDFGPGHPFRGDRYQRFIDYFNTTLKETGKFEVVTRDDAASDSELSLAHEKDYIQALQEASSGKPVSNLWRYISGDNVNPRTRRFPTGIERAARVIVKNAILSCDLVHDGQYEKAVCLGGGLHHARPRFGEGFCIYNDVVIAARHLITKHWLKRILILDTDAHAGNGTCEAFYSDPRVLFIDIHQKFIYPGSGYEDDIGDGAGTGFTVNVPLPAFAGDDAYRLVFDQIIFPLTEEFNPQIIIRNGGSDPHPCDEITQLGLTLEGFRYVGASVRKAAEVCEGKEVDLLCSGYRPEVLSRAWTALIAGLANVEITLDEPIPVQTNKKQMIEETGAIVEKVKENLQQYWSILKR
jgi:acetoin utilization protein AcuC